MKKLFACILTGMILTAISSQAAGMDSNGDGQISKEEFIAFRQKQIKKRGREPDQKQLDSAFQSMDLNGDGFLSEEEKSQAGGREQKDGDSKT